MLESEMQGNNASGDFGDEDLDNLDASAMATKDDGIKKDAINTAG